MTEREQEPENGEERIDEQGRNETQQAIDEESSDRDGWEETNDEPAQGEGGQDVV